MDSEVMEIESNQVPHIFKCPTCLDCWQAGHKMLTHFLLPSHAVVKHAECGLLKEAVATKPFSLWGI